MATLDYPIDENGDLILKLTPQREHGVVKAQLISRYAPQNSQLINHILPLLRFSTTPISSMNPDRPPLQGMTPSSADFEIRIPDRDPHLNLYINGVPFKTFELKGDHIEAAPDGPNRKLTVFETRMIGRAPQTLIPLPNPKSRDRLHLPSHAAIKHYTPITDLHTHLSGQVSSHDLIQIGLRHHTLYPVSALKKLGLAYPEDKLTDMKRMVFLPTAHLDTSTAKTEPAVQLSDLSPDVLARLEQAMSLSPENQSTYQDMEVCYYLREPFTKNLDVLPDILRKVAQEYQKQGVQYAELSTNSVTDPKWLKVIHDVMPEIEQETGVALRFLAGIPRNLNDQAILERIEKFKRAAASPYIVGVDVLGYEMNKTSHLQSHLENLAAWIRDNAPHMVLRIHAGENPKNFDNVRECLDLAERYGIRMRIGHAVYGIDDATIERARRLGENQQLMLEFNPDSNMANNNIDFPHEIPLLNFIHRGVPVVLSSDGAGIYRTSPQQTMMAGRFCGVTPEGSINIYTIELSHIAEQVHIFSRKMHQLPKDFFESLEAPMPVFPPMNGSAVRPVDHVGECPTPPAYLGDIVELRHKTPILIAGAAGSSWNMISPAAQTEVMVGLRGLLDHCDPDKVCFVTGRTKDRGIGEELRKAIADYNRTHEKKFHYVLMEAESKSVPLCPPEGISHIVHLKTPLVYLPHAMVSEIKENGGIALYIGGKAFTSDFILESQQAGLPFGLMVGDGIQGASAAKAAIYPGHLPVADVISGAPNTKPVKGGIIQHFEGAYGMLKCVHDLFERSPHHSIENILTMPTEAAFSDDARVLRHELTRNAATSTRSA